MKYDVPRMPDHSHSTRQPMRRNRIVDQLGDSCELRCGSRNWRQRWCGSRNWRLRCLSAVAYFCVRCIAMRASRECKQHSANSNGLARRWLTGHKSGQLITELGVQRHVLRRRDQQQEREDLVVGKTLAEPSAALRSRERNSFA